MKILIALDGSEFAEAVIGSAAQLAVDAKAKVFLVQVVEPSKVHATFVERPAYYEEAIKGELTLQGRWARSATRGVGTPLPVESCDQTLGRAIQAARDYLHHVASRFALLQPEVVVLLGDDVDEELATFAQEQHVDLIAMSTHGRTGLARLVMGSHAGRMLRYRVAPLMIVRPDGLS